MKPLWFYLVLPSLTALVSALTPGRETQPAMRGVRCDGFIFGFSRTSAWHWFYHAVRTVIGVNTSGSAFEEGGRRPHCRRDAGRVRRAGARQLGDFTFALHDRLFCFSSLYYSEHMIAL